MTYDCIILGGGPAGYVAAIRAAQLGLKVACIEKNPTLGGTCLNVGCIPSKALLDSSEHFLNAKKTLGSHGVKIAQVELDLPTMMQRKDQVVRQLTQGVAGLLKKNKVDVYQGLGSFLTAEPNRIQIQVQMEAEQKILTSKNVLIATGSAPIELPFLPFDEKKVLSSTGALKLSEVPKHLVVIGGGVIGLELGSVWKRLGSEVTVVEFQDRLIPSMDRAASIELQKILTKQGMKFILSSKCLGKEESKNPELPLSLIYETKEGSKQKLDCDFILVSTGRRPYTDGLNLNKIGLTPDQRGKIPVSQKYETSVPGVYAVGDVIDGPMLAHKAEEEGIAAVEIMAGQKSHVYYDAIPNVVYTWPEVASVGATEEELQAKKIDYKSGSFPFMANGRAKAMGETDGWVKILADKKTDRVLGVHIIGPRASDLISEAVAIIEFGGSAEDIARTCHAHPTLSEVVKEAALDVDKRRIHL